MTGPSTILQTRDVETHIASTVGRAVPGSRSHAPILFLHGNPDSSALWHDVITGLPEFPWVAPDLPGFGRSRATPAYVQHLRDRPLETMVQWLDEVVRQTIPEGRLHLVVHDFGGPHGLAWAVRHPDRIASITAIDTLFFSDYRWHFWARVWRTRILGELSMGFFSEPIFRWEMRRGSPRLTDHQLREIWEFVRWPMKRMVLQLYRATDPEVFRGWDDELRTLMGTVPSLALWGAQDPYIHPEWAHRLGAQRVEILDDCGHWPPLEAPDRVVEPLRDLLLETPGAE